MRPNRFRAALAGTLLLPAVAGAQAGAGATARAALVASPAWVGEHLHDADLVLLHVGLPAEYAARHIPGARFVKAEDLSISDPSGKGLTLEMPTADTLRARLAALGISDNSRIVVYYGSDRVSATTRVMFTLDFAGLGGRSSLMDGGMSAWAAEGRALTDVVPIAHTGTLSPLRTKQIIVDAEYVRAHLATPGFSIVDGRASSFYDGVQSGGGAGTPHRTGHIAGARSVPFSETTDAQFRVRSAAELEAIFTRAGVAPRDTVVGYCHIGQQATAVLFAARTLGHPVLLYDGSFEDWSRRTDYPVENPAEKKKP